MTSTADADEPIRVGRDVYALDGTKIGTIAKVYPPAGNSDETWIAVDAGVSDGAYLVPCDGAGLFSEGLQVQRSVEDVQGSPHVVVDSGGNELSDAQLGEVSEYYGVTRRTSLIPGSAQADDVPIAHSAPGHQSTDAQSVRVTHSSTDDDTGDDTGDDAEPTDRQPSPGAVTVSGADGDVDVTESEDLRASRANARAAAGYDGDTDATVRNRDIPTNQE